MVIKYFLKGIIILLSMFIISCQSVKNPKERNILVFEHSIENIEDSISALNTILFASKLQGCIYVIGNDNKLYIIDDKFANNDKNVGFINDTTIYKSDSLDFIKKTDRFKFIELVRYLFKNRISQCNIEDNQAVYWYRDDIYMADMQEDLDRFVIYAESDEQIKNLLEDVYVPAASRGMYNLGYKILDKKGKLYLLAHKNARIWADD